jgi:ParB family transcriptional regulator, chromosome partitioning protein
VSKRGLPTGIRMRHDAHYVEELASKGPTSIGRLISVDLLDPNPEQPRVDIGDLSELIASVKEFGILEPILVRSSDTVGRWMIIAGERRWRAARAAGLRDVPCIEKDVDERAVAEIALIENMQRKDLTPWEEADGLAALCQRFGYTHEDVAKKVGKSRSTVTEALALASIPEDLREECRQADIHVKSLLLQIVRQPDLGSMREMIREISGKGLSREDVRAARRTGTSESLGKSSSKPFTYRYKSADSGVKIEVRFEKSEAERQEIIEALRRALAELESQP